ARGAPARAGHSRRAATECGGPEEATPPATAISEECSGSDTEIRSRRLRSHPCTKADCGENGQCAKRREAPGKTLLLACAVHDIARNVGLDGAPRKSSPDVRSAHTRSVSLRSLALSEHLQHEHCNRQPDQGHRD